MRSATRSWSWWGVSLALFVATAGGASQFAGTTTGASPTVTVTGASVAPATAPLGTWTAMLRLALTASTPTTLTQLRVRDLGTVPADKVALRQLNSVSSATGTVAFQAASKTWTLTFSPGLSVPTSGALAIYFQLYVGAPGTTGQLRVDSATVLAFSPASVVSGTFPLVSGITRFGGEAPKVTVTSTSLAPATAPLGTWTSMLRLSLTATTPTTLTQLRVRDAGTVPSSRVALRVLNGTANAGTQTYDAATKTWTLTFSPGLSVPVTGALALYVQEYAGTTATTGRVVVDSPTVLLFAPASTVTGAFPLTSATTTFK